MINNTFLLYFEFIYSCLLDFFFFLTDCATSVAKSNKSQQLKLPKLQKKNNLNSIFVPIVLIVPVHSIKFSFTQTFLFNFNKAYRPAH